MSPSLLVGGDKMRGYDFSVRVMSGCEDRITVEHYYVCHYQSKLTWYKPSEIAFRNKMDSIFTSEYLEREVSWLIFSDVSIANKMVKLLRE